MAHGGVAHGWGVVHASRRPIRMNRPMGHGTAGSPHGLEPVHRWPQLLSSGSGGSRPVIASVLRIPLPSRGSGWGEGSWGGPVGGELTRMPDPALVRSGGMGLPVLSQLIGRRSPHCPPSSRHAGAYPTPTPAGGVPVSRDSRPRHAGRRVAQKPTLVTPRQPNHPSAAVSGRCGWMKARGLLLRVSKPIGSASWPGRTGIGPAWCAGQGRGPGAWRPGADTHRRARVPCRAA